MVEDRSSRSPATSPEMDPEVWSRMPEDLLDHVLSFLPLKTILTLRSTCKHFKSLISSPSFISKHSSLPSSSSSSGFSSFLLLSHGPFPSRYPLFDAARGSWRMLSLSLSTQLPSDVGESLLSVSRSLLCFSLPSCTSSSSYFLVCNILARTSRVVRSPIRHSSLELITLISAPTGFGFTLFALCSASNTPLVYDSGSQLWVKFDPIDSIITNNNNYQQGVFFKGCLYFTTPEPISIVSFDLGTGMWRRSAQDQSENLTFARLAADGGGERMFMVGGVGENGIAKKVKLWELVGGERGSWVEVGSVPELMCRKFTAACYHNYEHVYCLWHEGLVCVCMYTWPEVLYYKVGRMTWHWLPKCPAIPERWSCGFRWFSLVPELHAFV